MLPYNPSVSPPELCWLSKVTETSDGWKLVCQRIWPRGHDGSDSRLTNVDPQLYHDVHAPDLVAQPRAYHDVRTNCCFKKNPSQHENRAMHSTNISPSTVQKPSFLRSWLAALHDGSIKVAKLAVGISRSNAQTNTGIILYTEYPTIE